MLELIIAGKYLMYPLLLCSIVTLAIIVDRLLAFRMASRDSLELRNKINNFLHHSKYHEAVQACEDFGGPVAAVLLVTLRRYEKLHRLGKSTSEIEMGLNKIVNDYAPHVMEALEKRVHILMLIAGVAPLLGMTGTCTGMISSFTQMADAGVGGQAVASGISEALITTASGLIVAIPALIFHNLFTRKIDRFILDIEDSATGLIDYVTLDHVTSHTQENKSQPTPSKPEPTPALTIEPEPTPVAIKPKPTPPPAPKEEPTPVTIKPEPTPPPAPKEEPTPVAIKPKPTPPPAPKEEPKPTPPPAPKEEPAPVAIEPKPTPPPAPKEEPAPVAIEPKPTPPPAPKAAPKPVQPTPAIPPAPAPKPTTHARPQKRIPQPDQVDQSDSPPKRTPRTSPPGANPPSTRPPKRTPRIQPPGQGGSPQA